MIRRFWRKRTAWPGGVIAGLAVAAIMAATITGIAQPAEAAAGGSILSAGQELQAGQDLVSSGGQYTLVMQTDGNLVTYGNGCVIWASNTAGTGSNNYLAMQGDGNLVIYTGAGKPVWASNTAGTGSANYVAMQGDGNLVVYTTGGKPVWASGASEADQLCAPATMSAGKYLHSSSGQYTLNMQGDGNLVIYDNGNPIWASNTAGTGSANYVAMQGDGNLVVYTSGGKPVWASNTAGSGGKNTLVMQNDGNLVVYTSSGTAVWASNTATGSGSNCLSYGYACTPGYDGANAADTWAWRYYGGSYAVNANGYHNCTLYAAWRLAENGMLNPGRTWGYAYQWASSIGGGNHTPAIGSIAWWGVSKTSPDGHVAYVAQVSGSKVYIIADNYAGTNSNGYTSAEWISSSSVDEFLHPHDL